VFCDESYNDSPHDLTLFVIVILKQLNIKKIKLTKVILKKIIRKKTMWRATVAIHNVL
jgi:hypothetical protein